MTLERQETFELFKRSIINYRFERQATGTKTSLYDTRSSWAMSEQTKMNQYLGEEDFVSPGVQVDGEQSRF